MPQETRIPLHCDCCGREVLAELVLTSASSKVVIRTKRHGVQHCVVLDMDTVRQQAVSMPRDMTQLTTYP